MRSQKVRDYTTFFVLSWNSCNITHKPNCQAVKWEDRLHEERFIWETSELTLLLTLTCAATNTHIKYACGSPKQSRLHGPCMCYNYCLTLGRGSVRGVVKVMQWTEQYAAKWAHMLARYRMCRDHTMCTGRHKKEAAPQGRNQWRQGVIKLKMHGHCKVYEGSSHWKQLQGIIMLYMWAIQQPDPHGAATLATWTSFVLRCTVYGTMDNLQQSLP